MRIAFVGLGKLGMPMAETFAEFMQVQGYDVAPRNSDLVQICSSVDATVSDVDAVFVAVQTPHSEEYGGHVPAPETRKGFDTSWLEEAVRDIARCLRHRPTPVVVVSTVLPGTCREKLLPLLSHQPLVYNPAFVAMGSVREDMLNPEFVLMGGDDTEAMDTVARIYKLVTSAPVRRMSWESAELTKVAYNTHISMKIVLANALGELAEAVGADVDDVTETLGTATSRIISTAYTRAGMGDGGPCHPRDNIAMSWLAQEVGLSADPFDFVTRAREAQSLALARTVAGHARRTGLPVHLLGWTYKPGVGLTDGSPARLLGHYLERLGVTYDWSDTDAGRPLTFDGCALFVVGKCDPSYADIRFPTGSVVVDPCGIVRHAFALELIHPGRNPN